MSSAVQLAASRRLRAARAELDAQRLTDAVLRTQGAVGKKGEKGDTGPMPDHEWQGTKLRFEKPAGGWGEYVELRGPKGARGTNGAPGGGGGGDMGGAVERFDLSALPPASSAAPDEFIVRQGDTWVRASFAQMQAWFPGGALPPLVDCQVTVGGKGVTVTGEPVVLGECAAAAVQVNNEAVTVGGTAVTVNGR